VINKREREMSYMRGKKMRCWGKKKVSELLCKREWCKKYFLHKPAYVYTFIQRGIFNTNNLDQSLLCVIVYLFILFYENVFSNDAPNSLQLIKRIKH
jgi:hypothetical protein